jgi:hypothetical protein
MVDHVEEATGSHCLADLVGQLGATLGRLGLREVNDRKVGIFN